MARSSTPGKKGRLATWKLELYVPRTDYGAYTSPPPPTFPTPPPPLSPVLYDVYRKGVADLNRNGLGWALTLADDGLSYTTASDTHAAVAAVQEQLEQCHNGERQSPKSIQARRKLCSAPSTTKQ